MTTKTPTQYQHLEPRPGSNYRQLFLKGRRIRAAVVDEAIHGPDPRTPEEFARDYQVPLEAVLEASRSNPRATDIRSWPVSWHLRMTLMS